MKGIKKRLVGNFMFIIIITVLILEIILIIVVRENYYNNLEMTLSNQVKISADLYNKYFSDISLSDNVLNNVDTFWKQTTAQVEIIDSSGKLLMDSIGVIPNDIQKEDVKKALRGNIGVWIGKFDGNSDKVMSVSYPLKSNDKIVGVLRFITSVRLADRDINRIAIVFFLIGLIVIAISGAVSVVLSNTIIEPLREVTDVAEQMAEGNFKIHSSKIYEDEIGKLSDTLNYMADEIVKNDQLKNEFISSVSHELRTPLTSIKGWAVTLKADGGKDKDLFFDGLDIIEKESDRLSDMVEELLDFSKFISCKVTLKKENINIISILEHIKKQMAPRAQRDNIQLDVIYQNDLPAIFTDSNRLKQLFVNILDNAFNFTPAGGKITFLSECKNGNIIFKITDTGSGISSEDLPHVKEKFYKGKTSKSKNGIGLSICDEIVHLMKGTLEIESQPSIGTTVTITIPSKEAF